MHDLDEDNQCVAVDRRRVVNCAVYVLGAPTRPRASHLSRGACENIVVDKNCLVYTCTLGLKCV